jgi:hypothetical protein
MSVSMTVAGPGVEQTLRGGGGDTVTSSDGGLKVTVATGPSIMLVFQGLERRQRVISDELLRGIDDGQIRVEVNMVFELPAEFRASDEGVTELALGPKAAVFHEPERLGTHMRLLFVTWYLRRIPVQQIVVDSGARLNVMLWATLGIQQRETNENEY